MYEKKIRKIITLKKNSIDIIERHMNVGESYDDGLRRLIGLSVPTRVYQKKPVSVSVEVFNILKEMKEAKSFDRLVEVLDGLEVYGFHYYINLFTIGSDTETLDWIERVERIRNKIKNARR